MNRELFIADVRRMQRMHGKERFYEALTEYVERLPLDPDHALAQKKVDKDKVIGLCCERFDVSLMDMVQLNGKADLKLQRKLLIYLLETRTHMRQQEIADLFCRCRAAIANVKMNVQDLMERDQAVREEIAYLNALL